MSLAALIEYSLRSHMWKVVLSSVQDEDGFGEMGSIAEERSCCQRRAGVPRCDNE